METRKELSTPHITRGSVLDDLGFSVADALEIKVKAEIYRELLAYIREQEFDEQGLASVLGVHQSEVNHLLNGHISKFSKGRLIEFAAELRPRRFTALS